MNEDKLSSSEVPGKFTDWLLSMGCPPDKLPSTDKIAQICRGAYYMVWRSLMEHVESKDIIRQKRLQVFYEDVKRCQQSQNRDGGSVVPREVWAWRELQAARAQVREAEGRVARARRELNARADKVAGKLAARELASRRVAESQHRVWLLQILAQEQRTKRQDLMETRDIAEDLCRRPPETSNVKAKVDRCLATMMRRTVSPTPQPVVSSSLVSACAEPVDNCEEYMSTLAACPAAELWRELLTRRAAVVQELTAAHSPRAGQHIVTPQCIVAQTEALHCQLSLEVMKNKLRTKQTQARLADALADLSDVLESSLCELLVVRGEQACGSRRAGSLRRSLADVTSRRGCFAPARGEEAECPRAAAAAHLHHAILLKKEDTNKLLLTLSRTERKIQSIREGLSTIFTGFQKDLDDCQPYGGGLQLELPGEAVVSMRQMYRDRLRVRRADHTLPLDDDTDELPSEPTFIDELRFYLKKFSLEKNRKLVLESGEKIWISETLQSSAGRLRARCLASDVTCALACPSRGVADSLRRLCDVTARVDSLCHESGANAALAPIIDITHMKAEEEKQTDKIKKRLNDNILSLQKTAKTLDLGQQNLSLWSQNYLRWHISANRTVDGKTYREYESLYLLETTAG